MPVDRLSKVFLTPDNSRKVGIVKGRTKLTPNILLRFGFVLSIQEAGIPRADEGVNEDSDMLSGQSGSSREFNAYTLFGAHEALMMAMLKERCLQDGLDPENDLADQLTAHINRGVLLLYPRMESILDVGSLLQRTMQRKELVK